MKHEVIATNTQTPQYKLITDLDKTFQPASELDKDMLILLGQSLENRGASLNITPVTGRPAGYVPAILEANNTLFENYGLSAPSPYGYGESGMIQCIPIVCEHQKFIFSHNKAIQKETQLIKNTITNILKDEFDMELHQHFVTDDNRKYSFVIQPTGSIVEPWKHVLKEKLISRVSKEPCLRDFTVCFRNDLEALQFDHKELNKSQTLAYEILQEINQGTKMQGVAFSGDGENDLEAAKWMVRFANAVKQYKTDIQNGSSASESIQPVLQHFESFQQEIDEVTLTMFHDNLRMGFSSVNVFLPSNAHPSLKQLSQQHPDVVIQSQKRILTGVLDSISKAWKIRLPLHYDALVEQFETETSPDKKLLALKSMQDKRIEHMECFQRLLDVKLLRRQLLSKPTAEKNSVRLLRQSSI